MAADIMLLAAYYLLLLVFLVVSCWFVSLFFNVLVEIKLEVIIVFFTLAHHLCLSFVMCDLPPDDIYRQLQRNSTLVSEIFSSSIYL